MLGTFGSTATGIVVEMKIHWQAPLSISVSFHSFFPTTDKVCHISLTLDVRFAVNIITQRQHNRYSARKEKKFTVKMPESRPTGGESGVPINYFSCQCASFTFAIRSTTEVQPHWLVSFHSIIAMARLAWCLRS